MSFPDGVTLRPGTTSEVRQLLAEVVGVPELDSESALRAIVVHELVHAADDLRFSLRDVMMSLSDTDRIQAYNAVMEGHAQQVARRICAANGWSAGFDVFTRSIGLPPVGGPGGEAVALLQRVQMQTFEAWYHDGERFFDAVVAADGPFSVELLYSNLAADADRAVAIARSALAACRASKVAPDPDPAGREPEPVEEG